MSLKKNTAWNLVGAVTPMLLGLLTIPYLVRSLGVEAFGILTLVWALIGYFTIFDFGIGRALTQQVSTLKAAPDLHEMAAVIRGGLTLIAGFGMIGGIALAASAHALGTNWLKVAPALQQPTAHCLLVAALGIPLTTVVTGLRGVLEGFEDFRTANLLKIILGCATFGLPALTVWLYSPSLVGVVISLVGARLVILVAHGVAVSRHARLMGSGVRLEFAKVRPLLAFGMWMTLSNVISPLMVTADRFLVSYVLGAAMVAYYTVPSDFIVRLLVIPAALTSALFPRFAALARTDLGEFKRIYKRGLFVVLATMLPLCIGLAAVSHWALGAWLGTSFAQHAWAVAALLCAGLLFNSLAQIPHAALQASGGVRATALVHLAESLAYFPVLYLLLASFGLIGAAAAWVMRTLVDLLVLLLLARRQLNV